MEKLPVGIPQTSGVYIFRDKNNKPLYIGKAVNLRARTKAYFAKNLSNNRLVQMVASASKLTWQTTDSEIEALILESQLIKKFKPRFNIMLRDDKQYFYVEITDEEFPKIFITHQPEKTRNSNIEIRNNSQNLKAQNSKLISDFEFGASNFKNIGPFTDGTALKTTLRWLRKIFPYCTCKQKHNLPCLNSHLGLCEGYCCLKEVKSNKPKVKKEYKKNIKAIVEILSGKKTNLTKKLEREMKMLAKRGKLENAIKLRNQLSKLNRVFENAQINEESIIKNRESSDNTLEQLRQTFNLPNLPRRIEAYDISNIQGEFAVGVMVVFTDGQPDKNQYRKFKLHQTSGGDVGMLSELLTRRFKHSEWPQPDLILVDGGKAQLGVTTTTARKIPAIALTKDDRHRGSHIYSSQFNGPSSLAEAGPTSLVSLPTPIKNLLLHIDNEAHRFSIAYYRKTHRRQLIPKFTP